MFYPIVAQIFLLSTTSEVVIRVTNKVTALLFMVVSLQRSALFTIADICMDLVRVRLSRERKLLLWYTGWYLVAWRCVAAAFTTIDERLAKT